MHSRCPHCTSTFEIPAQALTAADGVVRCGSCMQLFDARKHAFHPESERQPQDFEDPTSGEQDSVLNASEKAADIEANNDEPAENIEATFNTDTTDKEETHQAPETDDQVIHKMSLQAQTSATGQVEEPSAVDKEPSAPEVKEPSAADKEPSAEEECPSAIEEAPSTKIDEQPGNESEQSPAPDSIFSVEPEMETLMSPEEAESGTAAAQEETEPKEENIDEQAFSSASDANVEPSGEEDDVDPAFALNFDESFTAEDLRPTLAPQKSSFARRLTFSIAASLLVLGLGLQWLLAYNLIPQTNQTWLTNATHTACRFIVCDLKNAKSFPENYQSIDLLVQSHPGERDALILKTTLLNRSGKTLPYPAMAVEFSNLQNQVAAARIFNPQDYLNGAMLDTISTGLASNQPIEIELELADPGEEAINYSLHFLPPTQ